MNQVRCWKSNVFQLRTAPTYKRVPFSPTMAKKLRDDVIKRLRTTSQPKTYFGGDPDS